MIQDLLGDRGTFKYIVRDMDDMYARAELVLNTNTEWAPHPFPWDINVGTGMMTATKGMNAVCILRITKNPNSWQVEQKSVLPNQTVELKRPRGAKNIFFVSDHDGMIESVQVLRGLAYKHTSPTVNFTAGAQGATLIRTYL